MVLSSPAPVEQQPLAAREVAEPMPAAGQLRVRVEVCGVCHTDLHAVEGELALPRLPLIPGHQVVGLVEALGAGVTRPAIGTRVGLPWLHSTCGHCSFCRCEQENLCPQATFTGLHHDGGYAEQVLAEAAFVEIIPAELSEPARVAPLLCGGIIGYRALRVCGLQPGERLGLYGFGASAHIALQVARFWGCEVYVFSRAAHHLELARSLGAAWTGQPTERPPAELHRAINFTPAGALIPLALESLRPGGTLAMAGIYVDQIPPLDYDRQLYREKRLCSVTNATRRDASELLELAARIPIVTDVQEYSLADANGALLALKRSRIPAGAGVLRVS